MIYQDIVVVKEDKLRIIKISKPKAMNAISPKTSLEMETALDEFASDPDERVCIITGEGERAFCAGNDLKYQMMNMDKMAEEVGRLKCGFGGITERTGCYKPIISAVNGLALGGGFEIALACDIIIASENATFGLPEPKVGMMALAGGVHRLPRQISYHMAMGMMFSADPVTAEEGKRLGFVNEIVPAEELMSRAKAWASKICKLAPLAIQAIKEAVINGEFMTVVDASRKTFPITGKMMKSSDAMEGPMAFIEKREPNWKGQ